MISKASEKTPKTCWLEILCLEANNGAVIFKYLVIIVYIMFLINKCYFDKTYVFFSKFFCKIKRFFWK